jgi:hypothetical protein
MHGFKTVGIDDLPPRPGAGTGYEWLALRHALGARAFGCNAFRAREAGIEVIERHDEDDHEEMYVVLRGSATFTIGGETVPARAGTAVYVSDPKLERVAIADQPNTLILAVGGPPTFEPSQWEGRWLEGQ